MMSSHTTISLSAIGLDAPGLVSRITQKILELGGNIIDVEESCRRGLFSIFLVIAFPRSIDSMPPVLDSLKTIEEDTGLKVVLRAYDEEEVACSSEKEGHLVTVLGMDQPGIIASISDFFLKKNINIETCRMIARGKFFSMEMLIDVSRMTAAPSLEQRAPKDQWKGELKSLCAGLNQSVVIQSEDIFSKTKKLVVFDLESTLLDDFSLHGFMETVRGTVPPKDRAIRAQDDSIGPRESIAEIAEMLRGMPAADFERFSEMLRLTPGSFELIQVLKSMGFKIALLSSGFDLLVKKVFQQAGVDYAFSNTLQVDPRGIITGALEEPVITGDTKEDILEFIMNVEKIGRDQVIAIGDGSTRSHFIKNAGLSIAFKPGKESIQTDGFLSSDQIMNLLYCLGIPKRELRRYFKEMVP
ncbi:MAG: HAD-IB family phosphatase [Deltaproteobacteria bacterium]|nr:HAD-IB family phosphatase [Deltaproteobacteria bacterium]